MGLDLKKGKISPDGTYSSRSKDGGFSSLDLRFDTDLFDLVKGKLIDEGVDEKEALKIMVNLSVDELNKISEGLASMALKTGLAVGGGVLLKKGLNKAKKSFDNYLNKQRNTSPIGGNTRPGADKIEFGK